MKNFVYVNRFTAYIQCAPFANSIIYSIRYMHYRFSVLMSRCP